MILMLVAIAPDDQKDHVATQFDCLELKNAMVLLMVPLASPDINVGAHCTISPQSHVLPHFNYFDLRKAMVLLMMPFYNMMLAPLPMV